jgi:hypothetical protein
LHCGWYPLGRVMGFWPVPEGFTGKPTRNRACACRAVPGLPPSTFEGVDEHGESLTVCVDLLPFDVGA